MNLSCLFQFVGGSFFLCVEFFYFSIVQSIQLILPPPSPIILSSVDISRICSNLAINKIEHTILKAKLIN